MCANIIHEQLLIMFTISSYELEILLNHDPNGPAYQVRSKWITTTSKCSQLTSTTTNMEANEYLILSNTSNVDYPFSSTGRGCT